jgi:gliding motility-associated-like protein
MKIINSLKILLLILFFPYYLYSQVIFDVPGTYTWTVPPCVTQITVQAWAGGGGGGAVWSRFSPTSSGPTSNEACTTAGGGGGGGFVSRTYTVVPGQVYTIVVGAGGQGGTVNSSGDNRANAGSVGGNSTFSGPATAGPGTLTAFGGTGGGAANFLRSCSGGCSGATHQGANGNGGSGGGGANGTTTFTGGNGSAGNHSGSTNDRSGSGGGGAGASGNGGNANSTNGGIGGATGGGNGANGIVQAYGSGYLGTNGNAGNILGGGGGGASGHNRGSNNNTHRSNIGGNGARGEVRIIYDTGSQPTPIFNQVPAICSGETLNNLPTTSTNGISGSWSPEIDNTTTTTYTFTPNPSECANTTTMTIVVNSPGISPSFIQVDPICAGESLSPLPTTSTNGISGSWSPALNNSATTTYSFTPNSGQCATVASMTIQVQNAVSPIFDPFGPYCVGENVTLPLVSQNGISGSWNNQTVNTSTATPSSYTFTPDNGQCATVFNSFIEVLNSQTPTFNPIAPLCQNEAAPALSGTSTNGIIGTWSPATINTATAGTSTYTFTPAAGQCAAPITLDVTVNPAQVPTFNPLPDVCQNSVVEIPTTSTNGISGTWSPAVNTSIIGTTQFTFTPTTSSCIVTTTLTLTVTDLITPTFDPIVPVCVGAQAPILPTTSTNGVQGFWSDVVSTATAGTFTFTFTPNDPSCTNGTQISLTVNPLPSVNAGIDQTVCIGDQVTLSGSNGVTNMWDNGVTNGVSFTPALGTTTYTVIGTDANGCQNTDQVDVTVVDLPVVNAGADVSICIGATTTLTATGATTYLWDNGATQGGIVSPTVTTTYTVIGTAGSCQDDDQITVTVNPLPTISAPSPNPICIGQTVTLNGQGGVSYIWDNNVTNGVPFSPQITGAYTVVGTDANGCQNTATATVNVNPLPSINAGLDISVCPGAEFVLNGSGGVSYVWNNGAVNGVPMSINNTTIFTVTGTDINGCQNTDQLTVTILPTPAVDAGPDITICDGESVTLNGTGAPTLVWDNGVQQNVPFTPIITTTYTLLGVDNNGCVNQDQVVVTVSPIPMVVFSPSITTGCGPLEVTFTVQSAPGVSCVWDFGDGTNGTGCGSVTHTYNGIGCFDVSMATTTSDGCVGTMAYADMICLGSSPLAEFTVNPSVLSLGNTSATMNNQSVGATSYQWNFGDGSGTSTQTNPSHTFPSEESGSYQVILIAINELGCRDTAYQVVRVNDEVIFYVPNGFTPDGDEYNNVFKPVFTSGFDPYDYNLKIFNRWGELIFESNNVEVGWNGSYSNVADQVQDGTYVWKIEFKQSTNDKRRTEVGHVSLIR